jgi:hypothetical protein
MTNLCERCRELNTSDQNLNIPDVQKTVHSKGDITFADFDAIGIIFQLVLEDTYPEYPVLKSSAEADCMFCGFLRDCIQKKRGEYLADWISRIGWLPRYCYLWLALSPRGAQFLDR